ncbi:Hypothetical protein NTJ_05436 [Nesidiocoris tenuis]|uniref:Uncharacterized protein n=1 Tax=Nesidiocoris tenuis TaxID=355587 RepID=A0ABN7AMU0_9HEMI|nr:Hypothetical protein NTJ_05436 [Nesidiocoris tenuis]
MGPKLDNGNGNGGSSSSLSDPDPNSKLDWIIAKLSKLDTLEEKLDKVSNDLRGDVNKIETKLDQQGARLVRLERQVRKRNIIWMGVQEQKDGGTDDKACIVALVRNEMKLEFSESDIEEIYRIGIRADGKNRPICMELKSLAIKKAIIAAKGSLAPLTIMVKEDIPPEERERRKQRWEERQKQLSMEPKKRLLSSPGMKQPEKKGTPVNSKNGQ